jgi:hypothetical protein
MIRHDFFDIRQAPASPANHFILRHPSTTLHRSPSVTHTHSSSYKADNVVIALPTQVTPEGPRLDPPHRRGE